MATTSTCASLACSPSAPAASSTMCAPTAASISPPCSAPATITTTATISISTSRTAGTVIAPAGRKRSCVTGGRDNLPSHEILDAPEILIANTAFFQLADGPEQILRRRPPVSGVSRQRVRNLLQRQPSGIGLAIRRGDESQ